MGTGKGGQASFPRGSPSELTVTLSVTCFLGHSQTHALFSLGSVGQPDLNEICFLFYHQLSWLPPRLLPSVGASEATGEEPAQRLPNPLPQGLGLPLPLFLDMVLQNPVWRASSHSILWGHLAGLSLPQTLNSGCKCLLSQPGLASIDNSTTTECFH